MEKKILQSLQKIDEISTLINVDLFIADVELLLVFFNLLCFRRCLNDNRNNF